MSRRRKAQIAAAIISGAITVATLTLFAFSSSIAHDLPQAWWFVAPFVLACVALAFVFQWLNDRL